MADDDSNGFWDDALSKAASPGQRGRVVIAVVLALLTFGVDLFVASSFARRGVFDQFDVLFDADAGSRLDCMTTDRCGDRSAFAHPGLPAFTNPLVQATAATVQAAGFLEGEPWLARRAVALAVAPSAAASKAVVVYALFASLGLGWPAALLLACLNVASFSQLLFGSIPESFGLSGLALACAYLLAVREMGDRPPPRVLWICVGIFTMGLTITNIVSVAVLFAVSRSVRGHDFKSVLADGALVALVITSSVVLIGLGSLTRFDLRDLDPGGGQTFTREWWHEDGKWSRALHTVGIFANTFTPPDFEERPNPAAIGRHSRYQTMFEVVDEPLGFARSPFDLLLLAALVAGGVGLARGPKQARALALASGLIVGFNAVLHTVWGSGLILYSQHWQLSLLVLLSGLYFWPALRVRGVNAALAVLVILLAIGNARMIRALHAALDIDVEASIAAAAGHDRPDLVLVVLDTVRRDRLGAYGYERDTSSHFDSLARDGHLFMSAHSTSGWTAPAHASMFTGLFSSGHGTSQEDTGLAQSIDVLAETLTRNGYQTVGVVGNAVVSRQAGYAQGFEQWSESWRMPGEVERDTRSLAFIDRFLAQRDDPRPLFLFVNLIGVHTPYDSCAESCGRFGADLDGGVVDSHWRDYYRRRRKFTPAEYDRLSRLYDAELHQADAILGGIVESLSRYVEIDDSVLVVTSDHGENIGDHGHVNHVFSLYESTTQVPLLVRAPGRIEAGTSERAVQVHDVYPTLLNAAGIEVETGPGRGTSLFDLVEDRPVFTEYGRPIQAFSAIGPDTTLSEKQRLDRYWRRLRTVEWEGWKLHFASDGQHQLYHLAEDPDERIDRSGQADVASIEAALLAQAVALQAEASAAGSSPGMGQVPAAGGQTVDRATRDELRALGYAE